MTQRHLARRAGLADITVAKLVHGKTDIIQPATERAILAITPAVVPGAGGRIEGRGTRRRLRALMALGYSTVELSEMIGMRRGAASCIMRNEGPVVETTRVAVHRLYEQLSMVVPPDSWATRRVRGFAQRNGYLPPLSWDDIDNDDQPANPQEDEEPILVDEVKVELALRGEKIRLTAEEKRAAILSAHRRRWSDQLIAERLHIADRTAFRIRKELNLEARAGDSVEHRRAA